MTTLIYNCNWSTLEDQKVLHNMLPVMHDYGDRYSEVYSPGTDSTTILKGPTEHHMYIDSMLRIKTRKRCYLINLKATHVGFGRQRQPLETPLKVQACFLSTVDWEAKYLDAEHFFLVAQNPVLPMGPRIGPYDFSFSAYVGSMYEDLVMGLMALKSVCHKDSPSNRYHLKVLPLGAAINMKSPCGSAFGPLLVPAYLIALQYAISVCINDSWITTLEFVDHTRALSPYVQVPNVHILTTSKDPLDFSYGRGSPALLGPTDPFCKLGHGKNNAAVANNSNLRDLADVEAYVTWPR